MNLSLHLTVLAIAITANIFLLAAVYRQDPKSATNRSYVVLSFVMSAWLVASYLSVNPMTSLVWARTTIFLATAMSACFFFLAAALPEKKIGIRNSISTLAILVAFTVMVITLTPFVFAGVQVTEAGLRLVVGPGMSLFATTTTIFTLAAIGLLLSKARRALGDEKNQLRLVLIGIALMVGMLIVTVLIPVVLFQNDFFVALAPLYTLIFLGMTAYAIVRYQLFDLKVIASEALTVVLWIVLISRIFSAQSADARAVDVFIASLAVIFGVLLIRAVRREVKQREELEVLTKQLEATNVKLEDLSRFKTQLLSIASHQIRSPLAAIKGFASLLLDGSYGSLGGPKIGETVEKIRHSANELIDLINNLLDLRKVEEGRMDYELAPVDLGALVRETAESLRPLAAMKKLEFSYVGPKDPFMVSADAQKLQQVIQNLIDNSIKYTPKGFVRVEVIPSEPGGVLCKVEDSGLGMAPELIPHLFEEEFVRDERVKKQILGTGLGLYIAKKIIEAHGGRIWAESKGLEKGSAFFVALKRIADR